GQVEALLAEFCGGLDSGCRVAAGVETDVTRQHDLLRVPADRGAVLVKHVALAGELLGRPAEEVPVLGEAGGGAQGALFTVAADAEGRTWSLHRLGFAAGVAKLVVAAVEGRGLLRQQPGDDLAAFLEPVAAFTRRT